MARIPTRKVTGVFPDDMLRDLARRGEVKFDSTGRVRGFSDYVNRQYKRGLR